MRNADLLPPVTSSYFFNLSNVEVQMPGLQVSTQNHSMAINATGGGYSPESIIYNDAYGQLRDGALADIPSHPIFGSLNDFPSSSSNFNAALCQQSTILSTKPALPQFQLDLQHRDVANARKRSMDEVNENLVGNRMKKKKEKQPLQAPVRRTQKLSDKITSLQKLVSPYGKTDTASVLQEACLYIRLLQEQIQNLFQMLSCTYNSFAPLHSEQAGMKQGDLRSRGLCLVPISVIQKMAAKESVISRN